MAKSVTRVVTVGSDWQHDFCFLRRGRSLYDSLEYIEDEDIN